MIFDTHTHLNVSAFEGEEKEVIARAKELAVTRSVEEPISDYLDEQNRKENGTAD